MLFLCVGPSSGLPGDTHKAIDGSKPRQWLLLTIPLRMWSVWLKRNRLGYTGKLVLRNQAAWRRGGRAYSLARRQKESGQEEDALL